MTNKILRLIKCSGGKFKKIESNPADSGCREEQSENPVAVTVKVAKADYVPDFVHVRSHISPKLFTATVTEKNLHRLEEDPQVISLSTPRRLYAV
ncbi:hypothetical protein [Fischerella sp. PCC 9605]|uniref:hypothetical protein n=1 Tax=Fischerella sp. PCC 9605 TaxID=1173024 RepID=UPI00047DB8D4|nr:hypothetical protein [Fischerella sp. PCC 9605]